MYRRRFVLTTLLVLPLAATHTQATVAGEQNDHSRGSPTVPRAGESFQQLDTDRNGRIDLREAARDSDLSLRYPSIDRNRDGAISRSEFNDARERPGPAVGPSDAIRPERPTAR